ncbi:MAG: hypothetical protein JOZ69_07290 [Myxococcales bacterium]|nr:hypothetical protein [Myxococcales bacterium]
MDVRDAPRASGGGSAVSPRAQGGAAACLLAAVAGACSCGCPREFRGIHDGDTIATTIVANDSARALAVSPTPGCGSLGDLPEGAVLTSRASVSSTTNTGGCFEVLTLTPRALTTGIVSAAGSGRAALRLPDGCTGNVVVYFQSPSETSSFLDDGPGAEWWLVRRFEVTGDPVACFGAMSPPAVCLDAFLGTNARE